MSLKVALLADLHSLDRGTGIARYDLELYTGLRDRGVEVSVLSFTTLSVPFGEAIGHAIQLPYHAVKKAGDFDLLHATAPITGLCFPFIKKAKVVTYHDLTSMLLKNSGNSFHARFFAPFFFRVGMWSDLMIAVSSQTGAELETYLHASAERLRIVNLGIGHEFRPLKRGGTEIFTVGYLGALDKRKRLDVLINAFDCLKKNHSDIKVKLLIYGKKARDHANLVDRVKKLKLEKDVEFAGFVPKERLVDAYNSLDVFVLPSEWEGFGLPILEAQKCGIPVVTRAGARIPEEVAKCAVKAQSEQDISEKIHELLKDEALRARVVKAGLAHSARFTWESAVRRTVRVYEEALQKQAEL